MTGLDHCARVMLILTWCLVSCGAPGESESLIRISCLGALQNTCSQDPLCVSVMAMNSCEAHACDGTYIGCLPVDAECSDRDEALCNFEHSCLGIYTLEGEYTGCEQQLCDTDSDCAIEHGYACFEGFLDNEKRCRQAPISCVSDDDCPTTKGCEQVGENAWICI